MAMGAKMNSQSNNNEIHYRPVAGLYRVYQPHLAEIPAQKKHPCADCHFCQHCSDSRCASCRTEGKGVRKKLGMQEQIRLYEQLNRGTVEHESD